MTAKWQPHQHGAGETLSTLAASVTVSWGTTRGQGYVVRMPNGKTRDGFGFDMAAAKRFGERYLRKLLVRSLAELGDLGVENTLENAPTVSTDDSRK